MKWYLLVSAGFVVLLTLLAMAPERQTRLMLVVPSLVLFYTAFVVFGVEYDRLMMSAWRRKEERIKEEKSQG